MQKGKSFWRVEYEDCGQAADCEDILMTGSHFEEKDGTILALHSNLTFIVYWYFYLIENYVGWLFSVTSVDNKSTDVKLICCVTIRWYVVKEGVKG